MLIVDNEGNSHWLNEEILIPCPREALRIPFSAGSEERECSSLRPCTLHLAQACGRASIRRDVHSWSTEIVTPISCRVSREKQLYLLNQDGKQMSKHPAGPRLSLDRSWACSKP